MHIVPAANDLFEVAPAHLPRWRGLCIRETIEVSWLTGHAGLLV